MTNAELVSKNIVENIFNINHKTDNKSFSFDREETHRQKVDNYTKYTYIEALLLYISRNIPHIGTQIMFI